MADNILHKTVVSMMANSPRHWTIKCEAKTLFLRLGACQFFSSRKRQEAVLNHIIYYTLKIRCV